MWLTAPDSLSGPDGSGQEAPFPCSWRCPTCSRKLEETIYQHVRIDRCTGCGEGWLDPDELEASAPEAHTSWLGELLSRMTGREEDSR